ncbi:hypothetical protein KY290_022202 [Solanum tuberosum]|uniref:At1g61320/AtMIF1 LRR domain-containing protein n=1 Tax=Solanum tuberosum TaxID=4113 RepID=A0ABQ7V5A1_SOLTU|nr:hypothetical protein KY289_021333 [Solanum tuberosum]KAH0758709.1 hypothetical protein KY290_022202 [Solanum tuberosum]
MTKLDNEDVVNLLSDDNEDGDEDEDEDEEDINLVLDNLQKLNHVKQLKIGCLLAEVVFTLQDEGVLPELKCKSLTVEIDRTEYNLCGIASVLQTWPLLETLNVHLEVELTDFDFEADLLNCLDEGDNTVFPNLKNVKIVGCRESCSKTWSANLFEFSKFLIKNAVALEEFDIVGRRRKCWECSESCLSRCLSEFGQKLLDIPRSFENFAISYDIGIEIDKVDKDQQATMEEETTDQALAAMELHNQMKIRDKHNQLYNSQIVYTSSGPRDGSFTTFGSSNISFNPDHPSSFRGADLDKQERAKWKQK